jgi:hypothetical protein
MKARPRISIGLAELSHGGPARPAVGLVGAPRVRQVRAVECGAEAYEVCHYMIQPLVELYGAVWWC